MRNDRLTSVRSTLRLMFVGWLGIVASLLLGSQPVFGGTSETSCIRDATGFKAGNICTANDVRISTFTKIAGPDSCQPGEVVTVTLKAKVESGPNRYDIGLWVDQGGGNAQDNGNVCYRDYLHPLSDTNTDLNLKSGSGPYYNAETSNANNLCGDVQASPTDPTDTGPCSSGSGTCTYTYYTFTADVTCRDLDGDPDHWADVSTCTSWDINTGKTCTNELDTNPGTSSKCNCSAAANIIGLRFTSPGGLTVAKSANPTQVNEPGGSITFTYTVSNTASSDSTLTALVDSIYGDLNGLGNCSVPQTIASGGSYTCAYTTTVTGNAGAVITNTVAATGTLNGGGPTGSTAQASVTILDVQPSISVTKVPDKTQVPEPGGPVTFTITVQNQSTAEAATLTSLNDDVYGDLTKVSGSTCAVPQTLQANGTSGDIYSCNFSVNVTGNASSAAGTAHVNTVTATATDDDGNTVTQAGSATVTISDVPSSITVAKDPSPTSVPEPGGSVTFTYTVTNTSSVDTVTITSLTDEAYGNLSGQGNCSLPQTLAPGTSYQCAVTATVSGNGNTSITKMVVAVGTDDDGAEDTAQASATVSITNVPPSVTITKTAQAPTVLLEPGGSFTFTLKVTNTSVEPVTITALTDSSALSAQCSALIGTQLGIGGSVSCTNTANYVSGANVYTNTATVTVQDDENSTATASASASVTVVRHTAAIDATTTTCGMFASGTDVVHSQAQYQLKGTSINSMAPGVMFYYTKVTAPASGQFVIGVAQSNNKGWPAIPVFKDQVIVYDANCNTVSSAKANPSLWSSGTGSLTVSGYVPNATYYISFKYNPNSLVGYKPSGKPSVTYSFETTVNGTPFKQYPNGVSSDATILVVPK